MNRDLELVLKFKVENAQALAALAATRTGFNNLANNVGSEVGKIQIRSKSAFTSITSDLTVFSGRVPIAGKAVRALGSEVDFLDKVGRRAGVSLSGIGSSLSGLVGPAALIAGIAGGILTLAKQAADAGDAIFDLGKKVNFSAESISTLKNEGELAGVEFGAISSALGIFNKNADAAQSGNKALANTFKALKVDLTDNETALRSTFRALAAVRDENQQAALAMKIFGRGGKEMLGIVHSLNGDIDAATEKFRDMNTLITTESARAANEFSDKLKLLEQKFDAVARAVGERFMPTVSKAMDDVNAALDRNKSTAQNWATDLVAIVEFAATQVGHVLRGLALVIEGFRKTFGDGSFFDVEIVHGQDKYKQAGRNIARRLGFKVRDPGAMPQRSEDEGEFAIAGGAGQFSTGAGAATRKRRGRLDIPDDSVGRKKAANTELQAALKEAQLIERETRERLESDIAENKRALDQQARDIEEFTKRAIELADEQLNATIDRVNAEYAAYKTAHDKKKITRDEFNRKDRELTIQTKEAVRKNDDEVFRLESERDQKLSEAQIAGIQRSQQREEEAAQRTIERIQRRIDQGILLETEGERQIADIVDEGFKRRIEILKEEQSHVSTSAERKAFITDEIIRLEGERAGASEQAANRIVDAVEREIQAQRRFEDELNDAHAAVKDIQLRISDELIRIMEANFASSRSIRKARRDLEIAEEEDRHQRETERINRQKEEADREIELLQKRIDSLRIGTDAEIEQYERLIKSLEALRQKREQLNQQQQNEDVFNQTRKRRVSDEADSDPFSSLNDSFESLGQTMERVFGAAEGSGKQFGEILGNAFDSVARGIGSMVQNYVLLGETGPAALRKVLAVALASLAAEATAKAIFYTAQGIADLFWNPARAASDFAAAAMFASIAGVSAIAGRAAAGDLFKQKGADSGGPRASDSGGPGQLNPITLPRNQPQQQQTQIIRHEHVLKIQSNDSHILSVISKDIRHAGPLRELILNDGSF